MHCKILVMLAIVSSVCVQGLDERAGEVLYQVFCSDDMWEIANKMKACFAEMKYDDETEEISLDCLRGMTSPITPDKTQKWVCDHEPEDFIRGMECTEDELKEIGRLDEYKVQMEPIFECLKAVFNRR